MSSLQHTYCLNWTQLHETTVSPWTHVLFMKSSKILRSFWNNIVEILTRRQPKCFHFFSSLSLRNFAIRVTSIEIQLRKRVSQLHQFCYIFLRDLMSQARWLNFDDRMIFIGHRTSTILYLDWQSSTRHLQIKMQILGHLIGNN